MKCYLVERASTVWSQQERFEGAIHLDPQPQSLVHQKNLTSTWAEPRPRAVYAAPGNPDEATGRALAEELTVSFWSHNALAPLDMGVWTGLRRNEVEDRFGRGYRQWHAAPERIAPPEGETALEAAERLEPFLKQLRQREKPAVVVASRMICNILLTYSLGIVDNSQFWTAFDEKTGWMLIDIGEKS